MNKKIKIINSTSSNSTINISYDGLNFVEVFRTGIDFKSLEEIRAIALGYIKAGFKYEGSFLDI